MMVAVMDWDSHRYLEAYFAVPMMGAVLQTVNVRLPTPQIAYTLQHAKAEIILVHRDFFPIIDAILPTLPAVKAVVAIMDGAEDALPGWAKGEYEAHAVNWCCEPPGLPPATWVIQRRPKPCGAAAGCTRRTSQLSILSVMSRSATVSRTWSKPVESGSIRFSSRSWSQLPKVLPKPL
jgi:acyl-CoA synthetase (AMP-forming)/AMP-acid ligase II